MAQMARDNESLFTNLKVTSFESSTPARSLFLYTKLTIICMLIVNALLFFSRWNRNIYIIGKRRVRTLRMQSVYARIEKHVTRSVQLGIKCTRMLSVHTLPAIIRMNFSCYEEAILPRASCKIHCKNIQHKYKLLHKNPNIAQLCT